jgi:hypothetical protein
MENKQKVLVVDVPLALTEVPQFGEQCNFFGSGRSWKGR